MVAEVVTDVTCAIMKMVVEVAIDVTHAIMKMVAEVATDVTGLTDVIDVTIGITKTNATIVIMKMTTEVVEA
jgi:hypothetical protein